MKKWIAALLFIVAFSTAAAAQTSIELDLEKNYLNLPASYDDEHTVQLQLLVDDEVAREFEISLPDADPDFWVFLDLRPFKGKESVLRTKYGEEKKGLELVYQSDERDYLENVYEEDLRPQLHYSSMRGWMNDPNGLIYYDGEYHLFHQHNPYDNHWGNMHWGHAVSKDLVHWEQLEEAIYPSEEGFAFSGSAVIDYDNTSGFKTGDENVMVAIYTTCLIPDEREQEAGIEGRQTQSLAYSNDRGRTWTQYEGNPVIGNREKIIGSGDARDPNVFWHEPTKKWVMILFEKIGMSIFTSDNLKDWTHESYFETFWECPELFELPIDGDPDNTKWVVYGGIGDYVLGDFDGKVFTPTSGPYSYTRGRLFAAQTFENVPESDGRQIQIGWLHIEIPERPFNTLQGFPTELTLRNTENGVRMFNEPVKEIEKLHGKKYEWKNVSPREVNEKLEDIDAELLHIKCTMDNITAIRSGFRFGSEELFYFIRNNEFIHELTHEDESTAYKYLPEGNRSRMDWEIILDRNSIEVFIDKGRFTLVLPRHLEDEERTLRIIPNVGENDIQIESLEVYEMNSIWN